MSTLRSIDKPQIGLIHVDKDYTGDSGEDVDWGDATATWGDSAVSWGGGETILNINKPKLR